MIEDIKILLEVRKLLQFEYPRIKEYGGAANFKTKDAIIAITNITKYINEKEKLGMHLIEWDVEE